MKRSQLTDGAGVPIATVSAPAITVDHALLAPTLDALKDLQPLPEHVTVHWTPAMTTAPAGRRSKRGGGSVRSMTSAGCDAAPNAAKTASTPTLPWPPPSLPSVPSCGPPSTATAGHTTMITTHPLTYWRAV
jgi:hypothetical protein